MLNDYLKNATVFEKNLSKKDYEYIISCIKSKKDVEDLLRKVVKLTKNGMIEALQDLKEDIAELEVLIEKEEEFEGDIPDKIYNLIVNKKSSNEEFEKTINSVISFTKNCIIKKIEDPQLA